MKIQIELRRPRWLPTKLGWRARLALGAAALLTVAVPVAWASHDFADVPDTPGSFHTEISAIKGAGITQGCGGGNYCPSEFVRRDAMAAFLHRGFGRAAFSLATVDSTVEPSGSFSTDTVIGQVTITVPGAGGTQFVKLDAEIRVSPNTGTLPYNINYYFSRTNCGSGSTSPVTTQTLTTAGAQENISHTWIAAAASGPQVFQLCGRAPSGGTIVTAVVVGIHATTYPLTSTGGASLGLGAQTGGDERP